MTEHKRNAAYAAKRFEAKKASKLTPKFALAPLKNKEETMSQLAPVTKAPHPTDIHIGKRLKELRTSRKKSQTELGKYTQISFQQIQKYECGTNRIAGSRLAQFAVFFEVSVEYFFVGLDQIPTTHEASSPQEIELLESFRAIRPEAQQSILHLVQTSAEVSAAPTH